MNAPALRISRTHFPVTALGPGRRLGVWVQGCPLACKGCMALDTWDPGGGTEVAVTELGQRWRQAIQHGATGLTVSGGEPLAQPAALARFLTEADRIRVESGRECDILLYTGYEPRELDPAQAAAIEHADVLVTGRYDAAAPTELIWRGSGNQTMVLRTDLGRRRYAERVHERPESPPIQVRVDAGGAWIVGVPRRGTLQQLDRSFKTAGLDVAGVSWRRASAD